MPLLEAQISTGQLGVISRRTGMAEEKLRSELMTTIADWLRFVIRKSFQDQATAEGDPWRELSAAYLKRKRGPGILREGGALFEQATRAPAIEGNVITAGSTLPYAAAQQFGFEGEESVRSFIHRVRGRDVWGKRAGRSGKLTRQKIALGIGKVEKHTRNMVIPARPYLPSVEFVEREGNKIAEEFVEDALGGEALPPESEIL